MPAPGAGLKDLLELSEMQYNNLRYKIMMLIKQSNGYLRHGPKSEKYALINRIMNLEYELFDTVNEILLTRTDRRKSLLTKLNTRHGRLRLLYWLYYEKGCYHFQNGKNVKDSNPALGDHRYEVITNMIDEIGRMIGGWIAGERDETARRMAANAQKGMAEESHDGASAPEGG